jgi:hypothetical protein
VATQQTRTKIQEARKILATQPKKADDKLDEAEQHTHEAQEAVESVQEAIEDARRTTPNLEDKTDPWEWFLEQLYWMIPTALVLVVGMYFGVGELIRPVFGTIGSALERRLGEMDAKVETNKMSHREAVAARRAVLGKTYEKSYKKQKESTDV